MSFAAAFLIPQEALFEKLGRKHYFGKQPIKRPALQNGFTNLYRFHTKLPWIVIRKIVPAAIDYHPRVTVPPEELKERLMRHDLSPHIAGEPLELFKSGRFNEVATKACEVFEDEIRKKTGLNLMSKAFQNGSILVLQQIQPLNEQDFLQGYQYLAMGAMAAIKNIFGYGNVERRKLEECYEILLFLNWLWRHLK